MSLQDHKPYFTEHAVSKLRPGELYAYENCEEYRVRNFLGACEYSEPKFFDSLKDAMAEAKALGRRAMIHCVAKRAYAGTAGICVCLVPV